MIIDTHCHLDHEKYNSDLDDVINRAIKNGIKGMIIPGADPKDLPKAVEICERYENIFFSIGVHPYDAQNYDKEYLKKYASHPKCIAVGECGLDYFRLPEDKDEKEKVKKLQKEVFISQIHLARELQKPLIVHIRDSSSDSKELLIRHGAKEVGGVLHCYNASEILLELDSYGFYFGIGGVVTFKNAKKLIEVLPKIPIEKILIETDAPYLTPHPHRGERNEPFYTTFVVSKIAEILDISEEKIKTISLNNTKALFKDFNKLY